MAKKKKASLIVLFILVVFFAVTTLAFSGDKVAFSGKVSVDALNQVRKAEIKGGDIALNEKQVNDILGIILKKDKVKGNITVKTPAAQLKDETIVLKVPMSYRKLELVLSSEGTIEYKNNKVVYSPKWFKVGKLRIIKSIVMSSLKKQEINNVNINGQTIEIDKKAIPVKISSIKIKDSLMHIHVDKFEKGTLFGGKEDIKAELKKMKDNLINLKDKIVNSKDKKEIEQIIEKIHKSEGNVSSKDLMNEIKKEIDNISKSIKNEEDKKKINENVQQIEGKEQAKINALSKVSGQLSNAAASLGSSGQQQVVYMMMSTVDNMMNNTSYDYSGDQAAVKAVYHRLPSKERQEVKAALASNVDGETISELRSAFGL